MGHRTRALPPLTGIPGFVRELRYHEASRQLLGLALVVVFAWFARPGTVFFAIGALLAVLGVLVRLYASGYVIKNKQLATEGPYSLVRHPLYTGNTLLLLGFILASGQWWAGLAGAAFWWFYYPTAIEYEDRKLHKSFGPEWEAWSAGIPAVIPGSFRPQGDRSWSFKTSMRRNGEPVIALFLLGWLLYIGLQLG